MRYNLEPLDNYLDLITYGFTNPMPDSDCGPWKITAKDVVDGRINYNTARKTTEKAYNLLTAKSKPQIDDILLTKDGTLGRIAIVDRPNLCINQSVALLRCNNRILPRYLMYLLQAPEYQARMIADSDGTTIRHIYITRVNRMPVFVPDLQKQQKILNILSVLDDKIELNQEINENLERQAEAVFAKKFLSNPDIPNGWRTGNLLEIADYLNGLAMQKYRPKDGEIGLPVLKIRELRQKTCDDNSELCSPSIKSEYIIHDGDVIFSWSGSLLVDFWCGGICGLNQHLFKVTSKDYNKWFYYSWTLYHLNRFIAIAADKATTMGHIKREELVKAEVLIPSKSDYDKIGAIMGPIYDLIIANRLENRKLAEVRASLLPKLMSGEIEI